MWPCVLCTLYFTQWKGSLFGGMQLCSCLYIPIAGAPNGANCEAGDFHANSAFSFLDNIQRPITIYTRARVSLLSSCSLEHWPSTIAEKRAVETQFLRRQFQGSGVEGLRHICPLHPLLQTISLHLLFPLNLAPQHCTLYVSFTPQIYDVAHKLTFDFMTVVWLWNGFIAMGFLGEDNPSACNSCSCSCQLHCSHETVLE